ncbi:MAG: ABC transporter ATP-binding protein [Chloroflexota bacterium]
MAVEIPEEVIRLDHVTKTVDGHDLLHNVTLSVPSGQLFGLIGPSGGGKTTTVRLMVGIYAPTSGEVRVFGVDPRTLSIEQREIIGYTPQHLFLQPTLTAGENLGFVASLYGIGWLRQRRLIPRLLREMELWDARNRLAKDLSGGMLRRLQLAAVIVNNPKLIFVDEPMAGLDPMLRDRMWQILYSLREGGTTIVITTQITGEAERCDKVAMVRDGHLVAYGTPDELRERAMGGKAARVLVASRLPEAMSLLWSAEGVTEVTRDGERAIRVVMNGDDDSLSRAVEAVKSRGIEIEAIEQATPSFDEVFERLVRGA